MADETTDILTSEAFLAEAARAGCALDAQKLQRLIELRLIPIVELANGDTGLPLLALACLAEAMEADAVHRAPVLREQAETFTLALRGDGGALRATYRRLRHHVAERAVLGELHRMLPVLETRALDTLRGDARLEWRLREALQEVSARLAADAFQTGNHRAAGASQLEGTPEREPPRGREDLPLRASAAEVRGEAMDSPPETGRSADGDAAVARREADGEDDVERGAASAYGSSDVGTQSKRHAQPTVDLRAHDSETAPHRALDAAILDEARDARRREQTSTSKPVVTSFSALREAVDNARRRASTGDHVTLRSDSGAVQRISRMDVDSGPRDMATPSSVRPPTALVDDEDTSDTSDWRSHTESWAGASEPPAAEDALSRPLNIPELDPQSSPSSVRQRLISQTNAYRRVEDEEREPIASGEEVLRTFSGRRSGPTPMMGSAPSAEEPGARSPQAPTPQRRFESERQAARRDHVAHWDDRAGLSTLEDAVAADTARGDTAPGDTARGDTALENSPLADPALPDALLADAERAGVSLGDEAPAGAGVGVAARSSEARQTDANTGDFPAYRRRQRSDEFDAYFLGPEERGERSRPEHRVTEPLEALRHPSYALDVRETREEMSDDFMRVPTNPSRAEASGHYATFDSLPTRATPPSGSPLVAAPPPATPEEALAQAKAALERAPEDESRQNALLSFMGGTDRSLARDAWATLAPVLRAGGDGNALLGALLLMAELETDARERVVLLLEAANVAEGRLRDHRQAFDLLVTVLRADPGRASVAERASALAEAYEWWSPLVAGFEQAAAGTGDLPTVRRLLTHAATLAEQRLVDAERAATLREQLVERGIFDENAIPALAEHYRATGRHRDSVRLLVRLAERESGEARARTLLHAADVAAAELDSPSDALNLYEQALLLDDDDGRVRRRYVDRAREWGEVDRALEFLSADARSKPVERALRKADIAREELDDPGAAARVLQAALPDAGARVAEVAVALADALSAAGRSADEVDVLREVVERTPDVDAALVVRLAQRERELGATDVAKQTLRRRLADAPERQVVEALAAMLERESDWDGLIDLYATCADRHAGDGDAQRHYIRKLALVASNHLRDDDTALALLEEAIDASGADPYVLLALASRCRRLGDHLSEMAALERIVSQGEVRALEPEQLLRLAELQMARPRGASRAAEVLELLVDATSLSAEARDGIDRLLPRVAASAGRYDMHVRWLRRSVEPIENPNEAIVLWKTIVDLQEKAEVDPSERVEVLERALECADAARLRGAARAKLDMQMATARASVAQWERAYEHASRACAAFLELQPNSESASRSLDLLADIVRVMPEHEEALRWLRRGARQGGVDDVLRYARAAVHMQRWTEAIPALETLLGRPEAFDPDTLSLLQDDLARAYRRVSTQ